MINTPHLAPLLATVDQIYARSPTRVPGTLQVCHCPVCMSAETLADIIATPVRDLTPFHLDEYRNSAHGVPTDPDDLRAMLPRYLDLIARDEWFDHLGVGADFLRFGDGRITHAPLFDPATEALLNDWARLLILHTGMAEVTDNDTDYSITYLTEVLLVGGWPPPVVTPALDDLFATDPRTLITFLRPLGLDSMNHGHFQFWALPRYRPEAIPPFRIWLNALLEAELTGTALNTLDPLTEPWAPAFLARAGNLTDETFASR
ncbi:MAG: hypothetical protein ACRC6I_22035 [Paracoccaceae bacterium]